MSPPRDLRAEVLEAFEEAASSGHEPEHLDFDPTWTAIDAGKSVRYGEMLLRERRERAVRPLPRLKLVNPPPSRPPEISRAVECGLTSAGQRLWTREDDEELLSLFLAGLEWEEIAEALGRTKNAVEWRYGWAREERGLRPANLKRLRSAALRKRREERR